MSEKIRNKNVSHTSPLHSSPLRSTLFSRSQLLRPMHPKMRYVVRESNPSLILLMLSLYGKDGLYRLTNHVDEVLSGISRVMGLIRMLRVKVACASTLHHMRRFVFLMAVTASRHIHDILYVAAFFSARGKGSWWAWTDDTCAASTEYGVHPHPPSSCRPPRPGRPSQDDRSIVFCKLH